MCRSSATSSKPATLFQKWPTIRPKGTHWWLPHCLDMASFCQVKGFSKIGFGDIDVDDIGFVDVVEPGSKIRKSIQINRNGLLDCQWQKQFVLHSIQVRHLVFDVSATLTVFEVNLKLQEEKNKPGSIWKNQIGDVVDEFTVYGRSKRGWTTWTIGAVDKRVKAMVPTALTFINMRTILR